MIPDSNANMLFQTGVQYLKNGFSIVVVSKEKEPLHPWGQLQSVPMSFDLLHSLVMMPQAKGIALIGGKPSRNFVAYDVDCKNDHRNTIIKEVVNEIKKRNHSLISKLVIAKTPSRGFHFYFLSENEVESRIIARDISGKSTHPVLVELRSKSQYSIVPPSTGYEFVQGDFTTLQVLNSGEFDVLIDAGTYCNRSVDIHPNLNLQKKAHSVIGSPLDDFDRRGNIVELLCSHGWKIIMQQSDRNRIYFQRPGSTKHKTSANFHVLHNIFITHSSSTRFLPGMPYKPSAVYAELECFGDYSLAAQKLLALGFGIPYVVQRAMGLRS